MNSADIKSLAKEYGADLVGIAPLERYEGAPKQMDPRYIMPEATVAIVMGFRIMRGSMRGTEEGTFFSNYASFGYGFINQHVMPLVCRNLSRAIEDQGYEAMPVGFHFSWSAISTMTTAPSKVNGGPYSKPVREGLPAPDVFVHMRIAAFLAGLGEIGWSKVFITPEYGPRVRFGMVLTDMPLEGDPIYSGPKLCNKCMACVRECPADAISDTKSVKVTLAGHEVEWGELDADKCNIWFGGSEEVAEGEKGYYRPGSDKFRPNKISPFYQKPRTLFEHGQSICGARGCIRECMIGLEKRGVVGNKFKQEFRRRPQWTVDWSDYEETAGVPGRKQTREEAAKKENQVDN